MAHAAQASGLADGLYRVTTTKLCAGFTIKDGKVDLCAPILRRKIQYWMTQAVLVTADAQPATLWD